MRTLVVVWRDDKDGACAHRRRGTAHVDCVSRVVRAGACDDLAASGGILDGVGDERELLLRGECGALAGGAADDDGVDVGGKLGVQKHLKCWNVDRTVFEGRHNRCGKTLKDGFFHDPVLLMSVYFAAMYPSAQRSSASKTAPPAAPRRVL